MRILTLSLLISNKAYSTGRKESAVAKELAAYLGITLYKLHVIKRADSDIKLSAAILMKLSEYFEVKIDDLLNPEYREALIEKSNTDAL